MKKIIFSLTVTTLLFASQNKEIPLINENALINNNVFKVEKTIHAGKEGIIVTSLKPGDHDAVKVIPIKGSENFKNGTIELELAGDILKGMHKDSRGFVGIAFRVQNNKTYEAFYIRPANGRADDQIRRNHSIQYISHPNYT